MSTYNALKYNVPFTNAGGLVLLSTQTASGDASISFTTGIDSTYKEYMFIFNNIHPQNDANTFHFQASTDGGSNYGITLTSTLFRAYHNESGTASGLGYLTDSDLAQSTSYQPLMGRPNDLGNGADESLSGCLHFFNPSDTTFVKHFMATTQFYHTADYSINNYVAGYFNSVSALNAVDFKMSSGNIDDGTIQMFGVVS
jgi:hypothetical protein